MTKRNRRMNLLYLPALGLVLLFVLLPLVTSVKTSFYNWNGYSPVKKFVGMKNYLDLFKDENFKMAFLNTPLVISGKNGSTLTGTMEQLNSFYTIDGAPYESREALKDGSFDFTKNTQFLDLYAELYDNGWFNEDIFTADQTTQFKYLGSGDYGFIPWGSPANIQTMKTYTPDVNFGIIPVPAVEEGGNAAYTVGEGSCLAISNTSENIDCCKALLNFLLEKDNLTEYCTANGGMPGLSDVTPEDSESLELYKKSVEAAGDNITYSNFFDREYLPSGMWNVMQETMAKLYNGEVGTAKDRVAEAASYFQENYKTLLGTNG